MGKTSRLSGSYFLVLFLFLGINNISCQKIADNEGMANSNVLNNISAANDLDGKRDWGEQCYQIRPIVKQAIYIYSRLKSFPNFFMFLGGHFP